MNYRFLKYKSVLILGLVVGCASSDLPSPSSLDPKEHDRIVREASNSAWVDGDFNKAIGLLSQAKDMLTDGGRLADGKSKYYSTEAAHVATIGHYNFMLGNIGEAAAHWRKGLEIKYSGAQGAQEKAQNAQETNAITGSVAAIALGAYLGAKTKDPSQVNAIVDIQKSVLSTLQKTNLVSIDEKTRANGLPSTSVVRVPTTADSGVFIHILRLSNSLTGGYCTAVRVSNNIAITNAHCVSNSQTGEPFDINHLKLAHERTQLHKSISILDFWTHKGQRLGWDQNRENDWAILWIGGMADSTVPFPPIAPNTPQDILSGSKPLMLAGYSSDLNAGAFITLHYNCRSSGKFQGKLFFTSCEGAKGSSGSAVFLRDPPYTLVGLHAARAIDSNVEFPSAELLNENFYQSLQRKIEYYDGIKGVVSPRFN